MLTHRHACAHARTHTHPHRLSGKAPIAEFDNVITAGKCTILTCEHKSYLKKTKKQNVGLYGSMLWFYIFFPADL